MSPVLRRLKEIRESKFLTQRALAERAGVAQVTVARLEGARHEATFGTTLKLAEALEVEPKELVGTESEPPGIVAPTTDETN